MIGAAGYIAPRHMNAIKETGNQLVSALDPNDSVGILDSYFPKCRFFTEFERFDRHIELLKRKGTRIDYVSIASPNYLHDSHIRFGLRIGAHAICEKPLVVNPWNLESLREIQNETGNRVFTILQLRLHPSIVALREKVQSALAKNPNKIFDVELTYITGRGHWYFASWKGEEKKSGGIIANIGVHFFDMLLWVFGPVQENRVSFIETNAASGALVLQNARVRWFLSVDSENLPAVALEKGLRTFRSITVDEEEVEFSGGFTDLHTRSYEHILGGEGFGLEDALDSIDLVHSIRTANPEGVVGDHHPFATTKKR